MNSSRNRIVVNHNLVLSVLNSFELTNAKIASFVNLNESGIRRWRKGLNLKILEHNWERLLVHLLLLQGQDGYNDNLEYQHNSTFILKTPDSGLLKIKIINEATEAYPSKKRKDLLEEEGYSHLILYNSNTAKNPIMLDLADKDTEESSESLILALAARLGVAIKIVA